MLGIKIILVGRIRRGFRKEAFDYYLQKVKKYTRVELAVVKDIKESNIPLRLEKEADLVLERIAPKDLVIALDHKGKPLTSVDFSARLGKWQEDPGRSTCLIVGGAYGLSERVKSGADMLMSFGPMTLPHELAAIILVEQLYRALTIQKGHPYHH